MRAAARVRLFAALCCAALGALGCAQGTGQRRATANARKDDAAGTTHVVVGPGAFEGGAPVLQAWLLYGSIKVAGYERGSRPPLNDSADDFDLELEARTAQSQLWAKARAESGTPAHDALDRQVEIWRAGFLPELVVAIHGHPGWTIPGKALASLRLMPFAERFAGDYAPGAPIVVETRSGKRRAEAPGADFPDPETLPYGPQSCGRAVAARAAAWRRWNAVEPRLAAPAVSADTSTGFSRQLIALQRDRGRAALGATWVSDRVGYLALLEGFCAIEGQDWPRAQAFLTRAVALLPAEPTPRLELSMALLKQGRVNEALAETDAVLATSDDGCAVATAWRRRGYILIDLGELGPAREAYQKSLVLEPGNDIAERELQLIASGTTKGNAAHDKRGFVPPAPGDVIVTTCKRDAPK